HLDEAWRRGYRTSEVSWALGGALGARYHTRLIELESLGNRPPPSGLDAALARLRAGGDPSAYARGLIAFYEGRYPDAVALAAEALEQSPWLYDAHRLEGDARYEIAWAQFQKREIAAALDGMARAGAAYARAL